MTPEYVFQKHIRKEENGCWIWTGAKNHGNSGYGSLKINGKVYSANRVSMYLFRNFDLNSKEHVLHKNECNNSSCVNPDHLYLGDHYDNMRDAVITGTNFNTKKTHCPYGHYYRFRGNGRRYCKICNRTRKNMRQFVEI